MLIARDGGCTKPCCTVGAYGCQVHHAEADYAHGGNTNIDELGLACGPDNRSVTDGGWTTRMNDRCEVEWIPPPDQTRSTATEPAAVQAIGDPETRAPRPADDPGGPAPPEGEAA